MRDRDRQRFSIYLATMIAALNGVMILFGLAALLLFDEDKSVGLYALSVIAYTLIAMLIIARQPTHIVGWLLLTAGFSSALVFLTGGLIVLLELGYIETAYALQGLIAVVAETLWISYLMIPLTLVLQFFPTGRLPSRRWWPVPAASLLAMVTIAAEYVLGPVSSEELPNAYNPLAISGGEEILASVASFGASFFAFGLIGSLLILAVRYRGADRIERTQMKWLFYTAMIGISIMFLSAVPVNWTFDLGGIVFISLPSLLPVAIGIAILRYRLFDIDIIIRRTLQYSAVTGILAAVYFGLVVTFQTLFTAIGGRRSPVLIVVSTLIIAALFNPLRIRVQEIIDRRFYRKKYDAERALAQFAAAARDEVNLDHLTAALLDIVDETMQPEKIQVWLRPVERRDRHAIGRTREEDNARI